MYKALDIANYIVNYSNDHGNEITNLKLQKLLYYVQAAMLVEKNQKCFSDSIVAWAYGPVVESVYHRFNEYGRDAIPRQTGDCNVDFNFSDMKMEFKKASEISILDRRIIDKVIDSYESIDNPFMLVQKTHKEDPWKVTKNNETISCETIKEYYSLNPEKIYH